MTKHNGGELGAIGFFLVIAGCAVMTVSILGAFDIVVLTDPLLFKVLVLVGGISLGLTEVVAGWLFAKHRKESS